MNEISFAGPFLESLLFFLYLTCCYLLGGLFLVHVPDATRIILRMIIEEHSLYKSLTKFNL